MKYLQASDELYEAKKSLDLVPTVRRGNLASDFRRLEQVLGNIGGNILCLGPDGVSILLDILEPQIADLKRRISVALAGDRR